MVLRLMRVSPGPAKGANVGGTGGDVPGALAAGLRLPGAPDWRSGARRGACAGDVLSGDARVLGLAWRVGHRLAARDCASCSDRRGAARPAARATAGLAGRARGGAGSARG